METKVAKLETLLVKVGDLGKQIKHDLRKDRDPLDILEHLGGRLVEIGRQVPTSSLSSRSSSQGKQRESFSKSPLRRRSFSKSPLRTMFGRSPNYNTD